MAAILRDCVRPPIRVLFVGINPGIRSAAIGHHFAGYSNQFWKLLVEAGLVPEPIGPEDDRRLPEWGYGLTNLVARATPGIDTLRPSEYVAGEQVLRRKVRRWKPPMVAFVGVTLYRAVFGVPSSTRVTCGLQRGQRFEGSRVFVLPNPSGRNANFSHAEMLKAYRGLARARVANHRRSPVATTPAHQSDACADSARVGPTARAARRRVQNPQSRDAD
jgi:TDG/mug DNA glycosylase family protein